MASSPVSTLSSLSSDDFPEDMHPPSDHDATENEELTVPYMPPAKRRRVTVPRRSPYNLNSPIIGLITAPTPMDGISDVSSDTTSSLPGSPRTMPDEVTVGAEQVRVCSWDGCEAGDLGNQDLLVKHVHDEHVGAVKRVKYTCEWKDCKAKSKLQLSAYSLRAHLRSHTKEKPFYCALPECDRSFTRSDALAKHMRTVHDSESLRTAEHYLARGPQPLNSNTAIPTPTPDPSQPTTSAAPATTPTAHAPKAPQRIKLVFGSNKTSVPSTPDQPSKFSTTTDFPDTDSSTFPPPPLTPASRAELLGPFPEDTKFTDEEVALPRSELFRLLRRQIHWANEESEELRKEVEAAESKRRREWTSKELVFENVLEAEFTGAESRGVLGEAFAFDGWGARYDARLGCWVNCSQYDEAAIEAMRRDAAIASKLPMQGISRPWYRDPAATELRRGRLVDEHNRRDEGPRLRGGGTDDTDVDEDGI